MSTTSSLLNLPSTFKFPSKSDYASNLTGALNHLGGFNGEFLNSHIVLPVRTSINTLIIGIESTVGLALKECQKLFEQGVESVKKQLPPGLAAKLADVPAIAGQVANFIGAVSTGNVQVAIKTGLEVARQVTNIVLACIGTIPVVGQIVNAVVGSLIAIVDLIFAFMPPSQKELERARREADERLDSRLKDACPKVVSAYSSPPILKPTRASGVTPSDMFRTAYVAAILGRPLPPTVASMFILMCGAETQGVGFTRNEYLQTWNHARSVYGKKWIGIHPEVQRRMWSLCKSIMFSCEDPELSKSLSTIGDGGVAAFSALQDIVRNQWIAGNWDKNWLGLLSSYLGNRYGLSEPVIVEGKQYGTRYNTCGGVADEIVEGRVVGKWTKIGLDYAFWASQENWANNLKQFCDPTKSAPKGSKEQCAWQLTASPSAAMAAKSPSPTGSGTLLLAPEQADRLAGLAGFRRPLRRITLPSKKIIQEAERLSSTSPSTTAGLGLGASVGLGLGVALLGYGAYSLASKED